MLKPYDEAYFDRWYRDARRRVRTPEALRRKVRLAVSVAELFLGRPLETVLDVGCGEGAWLSPLKGLRPRVAYLGLDPSEYAVRRFGAARNLRLASFGEVGTAAPKRRSDLVVASDVLHYVPDEELLTGLPELVKRIGGVAFLEVLTTDDEIQGDLAGWHARSARFYRELFRKAGLVPVGMQCYLGPDFRGGIAALERLEA